MVVDHYSEAAGRARMIARSYRVGPGSYRSDEPDEGPGAHAWLWSRTWVLDSAILCFATRREQHARGENERFGPWSVERGSACALHHLPLPILSLASARSDRAVVEDRGSTAHHGVSLTLAVTAAFALYNHQWPLIAARNSSA